MYKFIFIVIFVNIDMFMKVFIQLTNLARKMHKIVIVSDLIFVISGVSHFIIIIVIGIYTLHATRRVHYTLDMIHI